MLVKLIEANLPVADSIVEVSVQVLRSHEDMLREGVRVVGSGDGLVHRPVPVQTIRHCKTIFLLNIN